MWESRGLGDVYKRQDVGGKARGRRSACKTLQHGGGFGAGGAALGVQAGTLSGENPPVYGPLNGILRPGTDGFSIRKGGEAALNRTL